MTARIITEPKSSLTVLPPEHTDPSGTYWLDDPSDLTCKDSTRQHAAVL
jgi:hypothetical protein